MPGAAGLAGGVNSSIQLKLWELAVAWMRDFARQIYTGSPANNTGGGGHKEFYGLDTLINTGYRDAESGNACIAADSLVRNFGNAIVNSNGPTIVEELTNIFRYLRYQAAHVGLAPTQWMITMPFGLFYSITDIWPCAYNSYRCAVSAGSTQFLDAAQMNAMRDAMRGDMYNYTGQYLLIDGERVPVCIDDAITDTVTNGVHSSTIYIVPMTVLGRVPVTYMEYFSYTDGTYGGSAMDAARTFAPAGSYVATDNGRFLLHMKPPTNFCVQMLGVTEPRLLLLTPHLAARLDEVGWTQQIAERDWDPAGTYFYNGGRTTWTAPSFYSPTG